MIRNIVLLSFVLIQTLYSSDQLTHPPTMQQLQRLIQNNILDIRDYPSSFCPDHCCVRTFVRLAEQHRRETGNSLSLYCRFLNHDHLSTFVENMHDANKEEYTIAVYDHNQTCEGTFTRLNNS